MGRGTGLAASTSAGGPANMAIMDLLLEHGADVNAQVTGTKTYSMRVSRAPSSTEGMTALHVAAQRGNARCGALPVGEGSQNRSGWIAAAASRSIWQAPAVGNPERLRRRPAAAAKQARPKLAPFCRTRPLEGREGKNAPIGDRASLRNRRRRL